MKIIVTEWKKVDEDWYKKEKLFDGSYEINTESLADDKSIVKWLVLGIAIGIVAMGIIMMIVLNQNQLLMDGV